MRNLEEDVEDERLAQRVLRLLSGPETLSTEELAAKLDMGPVETLVLLRRMGRRVVDVTDFAARNQGRTIWLAAEVPLRTT